MSVQSATPSPKKWWNQFPPALRLITRARLVASIGAGGVIYLTPLVFNQMRFSATEIGSGIAAAALVGTIARILSGWLLDKGISCSWPIKVAALFAIFGDLCLLNSQNFETYLQGQVLIGVATGLYWPAIELAVTSGCNEYSLKKSFALARSSDALGISLGVLLGSLMTLTGSIRGIYLIDSSCMLLLLVMITRTPLKDPRKERFREQNKINSNGKIISLKENLIWLDRIIPILILSLLATSIASLLQSALPLDLAKGGINRPPLNEAWIGVIITLQLSSLVVFQWPIGSWIAKHKLRFGYQVSLYSFCIGCLLLGLSSLWEIGIAITLIAQIPLSFALASFLPTATASIIDNAPIKRQGIAMAMFSQCFAISAIAAPIFSGFMLDRLGNGIILWIGMSALCMIMLPIIKKIK